MPSVLAFYALLRLHVLAATLRTSPRAADNLDLALVLLARFAYDLLSKSNRAGMVNGVIGANDTAYLVVYRIYLPLVNRSMTIFTSCRTDLDSRNGQPNVRHWRRLISYQCIPPSLKKSPGR